MIVLGFYKYVDIDSPERLATELKNYCEIRDIRGTILVSREGINASVSGCQDVINHFKSFLRGLPGFSDLYFKEEETASEHPFKKMMIKVKKEIVRFEHDVDLKNRGRHISADEFLSWYNDDGSLKENVVILDARNDYEYKVGRFKGAEHLQLNTFREFTKKIDISKLKDKKVIMYCTGGVRCEKASAYVREQGVKDVVQLHQGIIQFGKEKQNSVWEGKCFVFDKRMVSPINADGQAVSECYICGTVSDFLRNCRNRTCDRFYVSCQTCEDAFNKCCSKACMQTVMQ